MLKHEDLLKMTNTELLNLMNKYADEAEATKTKMLELLDKMEKAEQNYALTVTTLDQRLNPESYDENGDRKENRLQ